MTLHIIYYYLIVCHRTLAISQHAQSVYFSIKLGIICLLYSYYIAYTEINYSIIIILLLRHLLLMPIRIVDFLFSIHLLPIKALFVNMTLFSVI